jgi:hypothetical protein
MCSARPADSGRIRRSWRILAGGLALLAGVATLYAYDPATRSLFLPCPFHALTGLHCPGCGTLRGLHQLLHGNLWAALRMNPLMVVSLPFLGFALAAAVARLATGRCRQSARLPARWIWALLVLVLAYWVLRNVPCYPFSLLAPITSSTV